MSSLKIIENYREQSIYRNLFFDFTPKALYGADFKQWYLKEKWDSNYKAVSLLKGGQIIANVSYSTMKIWLAGELTSAIQLATVGTLPAFKNKGYARKLMNFVLEKVDRDYQLVFLFANEHVLDFYPKFGFVQKQETLFYANGEGFVPAFNAIQLSLASNSDYKLLTEFIQRRQPITKKFGADNYSHILWWHIIYYYHQCLYYVPALATIVIFEILDGELHIYDILSDRPMTFSTLVPQLIANPIRKIVFYFTPELLDVTYEESEIYTDSPLFVRGSFPEMLNNYKFPALAQT